MLIPKKYVYKSYHGIHFPDADVGDEMYYSIDLAEWLSFENDTVTNVSFSAPSSVAVLESSTINNTEVIVKLRPSKIGLFTIKCAVTSQDLGKTQINIIPIKLRVL